MLLEDSAFTAMPRKAIKFNQAQIESRSNLNLRCSHQDPGDIFWYEDAAGCFEKFCFGAQIVIQNLIITAGIPFSRLCSFPSAWN